MPAGVRPATLPWAPKSTALRAAGADFPFSLNEFRVGIASNRSGSTAAPCDEYLVGLVIRERPLDTLSVLVGVHHSHREGRTAGDRVHPDDGVGIGDDVLLDLAPSG
jgi:hypothetical protein